MPDEDPSAHGSGTENMIFGLAMQVVTLGCEIAMVVGGVVPYIPQYIQIKKKQTTQGFSIYVCLALLMANTMRILFWFGNHYETPLLIQSILMNIAMFVVIQLCVSINTKDYIVSEPKKQHVFTDFEPNYFWQWTDFASYVECIMTFGALGAMFMYFLIDYQPFVETVGFAAVFTEATLGMPQFYRNWKKGSTYGMSMTMVCMWTCGDLFKTTYFYIRNTPPQFFICGSLQVCVDLCILCQVWLYREETVKKKKSENMSL
jgi:uncharacterized protein with PQ loop repeat